MEKQNMKLKDIVKLVNSSEISSIRSVVTGIVKIINDPGSNAKDLKDLIEVDPPLTAKVLKVANSAYYSRGSHISEITQAIIWIGYDAVKEVALNQKVCEIFKKDKSIDGYSRVSVWKHSIAVGLFGKMLYRREFGERGENIYAAGILHDIGIIAEDQFLQAGFIDILRKTKNEKKYLADAERDVFGYNHADVGKAIAGSWDLPQELVMILGYHHNPFDVDKKYLKMVLTLYVADTLCQESGIGFYETPSADANFLQKCVQTLKVQPEALKLILADTKQEISKLVDQGLLSNA